MRALYEKMSPRDVYCEFGKQLPQAYKGLHIQDQVSRLLNFRYEALTSSTFVNKKDSRRGRRCGHSEAQQRYVQANQALKKARKRGYRPTTDGCRDSQQGRFLS